MKDTSDFEAFNGPLHEVEIPNGYVKRLQDAMEGEMDGLLCDDDTAVAILRYVLAAAPLPPVEEEKDTDKAAAWDQCVKSSQRARDKALEEAATVAYRICAETRHVTLGDKAAAAIRALAGGKPE